MDTIVPYAIPRNLGFRPSNHGYKTVLLRPAAASHRPVRILYSKYRTERYLIVPYCKAFMKAYGAYNDYGISKTVRVRYGRLIYTLRDEYTYRTVLYSTGTSAESLSSSREGRKQASVHNLDPNKDFSNANCRSFQHPAWRGATALLLPSFLSFSFTFLLDINLF